MSTTLAEHLSNAIRTPATHGARLAAVLRSDPAMMAQANALLAERDATIQARGESSCWISARDARVLRAAIGEGGA